MPVDYFFLIDCVVFRGSPLGCQKVDFFFWGGERNLYFFIFFLLLTVRDLFWKPSFCTIRFPLLFEGLQNFNLSETNNNHAS